jgi:hypothetical protein
LQQPGLLGRWYRLAAYHLPEGQTPTLVEQELIRRSRLATFVLVVQLVLIEEPVVPVVAAAPNGAVVFPWLLGCIAILLLAFACNRAGKLTVAGLCMVLSIEITVGIKLLTLPGGIALATMPQFDILIQPVLLAVVLLPPWTAFAVAGFNILFVLGCLFTRPLAPDLVAALHNHALAGDLIAVPVMAEVIIATVAFLVVANLHSALKRAGRAEQIAALEHDLAQSRGESESKHQQLEEGLSVLVRTIQSATGQEPTFEKIPLSSHHALWPLLQQLWVFLDRYQRARKTERHYEAMVRACTLAQHYLDAIAQGQLVPLPPRTDTPVDGLLFTLGHLFRQQPRREGSASRNLTDGLPPQQGGPF